MAVTNLKETTAQGVEGDVDGKHVKVGKLSFVAPDHEKLDVTSTAVYISINGKFAGYITLKDKMRPESPETNRSSSSSRCRGHHDAYR